MSMLEGYSQSHDFAKEAEACRRMDAEAEARLTPEERARQEAFAKFTMAEAIALLREKGCTIDGYTVYEENPLLDHTQYTLAWPGETEARHLTTLTLKNIAFRVMEGKPCPPIDRVSKGK